MRIMKKWHLGESPYAFYAESNCRGIYVRPDLVVKQETEDGDMPVAMRFPGAYVCITDDGSISTNHNVVQKIWDEIKEKEAANSKKSRKLRIILDIMSIVLLFTCLLASVFINEYLISFCVSLFWILKGFSYISNILLMNWQILKGDKEIKQKFRFHAAEHAVINAYYDLKRVPTLEEIKCYSNFSYNCNIPREVRPAWFLIGIGLCRLAPGLWFIPMFVIFMLLSYFSSKKNFFFIEVLCLAEPTDIEYEVAIKAMTCAIELQKKIQDIYNSVLTDLKKGEVDIITFE